MLTISTPAYERLTEMLVDRPEDVAVRIVLREGKPRACSSRQRRGDKVIEHDGRTVLLLDRRVARRLNRRLLEVRETTNGPRLRLKRVTPEGQS